MATKKLKLNYAQIDRDKIVAQVEEHFRNSGFGKLIDSKLVSFLVDAFGATAEFIIYYIERRAEEGFFATAKMRSSMVVGSRSFGYSIRRPSPASATVHFALRGNAVLPTADYTGKTMQFPIGMRMVRNGLPFILTDTFTYKFKSDDTPTYPTWTKLLVFATREADGTLLLHDNTEIANYADSDRIDIVAIQGETREVTINFSENPISGQIFQKYWIDDPEFSDYFGINDPRAYNPVTGLWSPSSGFTQVSVNHSDDPPYSESSLYKIDRRSLVNHETLYRDTYDKLYDDEQNLVEDNVPKVCVIRTSRSGGVELMFGDGLVSEMPKSDQIIRIRYLATKGTSANEVGSRGTSLSLVNPIYAVMPSLLDVTQIITPILGTNILGGADIEDIESIRVNAPSIYTSLDRLVGMGDHVAFLTTLTSPIRIAHAMAWGEQEEVQASGYRANKRYSNHVYYTVVGNLYEKTSDGSYAVKPLVRGTVSNVTNSLNENGLLEGFDYDQYSEQAYFNILVADRVVSMRDYERKLYEEFFNRSNLPTYTEEQKEMVDRFPLGHPVSQLTSMIEKRSQLTVKPRYVTPIIQEFKLGGSIVVRDFADIEQVRKDVESAVYSFLDANVNYNTEVFLSHINAIVKENPDVARADLKFIPVASDGMVINDWMTEPEMMAQVPYEYDRFLSMQNQTAPTNLAKTMFSVIPDSNGNLTIDEKFHIGNMNDLVGMKIRLSQNGGVSYGYAEITSVSATQQQPKWYVYGLMDETTTVNMLNDRWYILNGTVPSGIPVSNQPSTSHDLIRKRWTRVMVGGSYQWRVVYDYTSPSNGDIVNVAKTSVNEMRWFRFNGSWQAYTFDSQAPVNIWFRSNTVNLEDNKSLIAEVVTNMQAVYDSLGFDPKVYLVEAFQTAISKEVKRLFDVVHHKYCDCPPDMVPDQTPTKNVVADTCNPFGMRDHIWSPYQTVAGDCHENTNKITWNDWSKSYYRPKYESFTRCGELFILNDGEPITKDQWSNGRYNNNLDIAEFERVTALGSPWRLGAPPKDEANEAWVTESTMHHRIGGINERWFYQTLMRNVIIELRAIAKKKADSVNSGFYTTDRKILDLFLSEFGKDGSTFKLSDIQSQVKTLLESSAYIEDIDAPTNVEKFISSKSFRGLMLKLHNGITQAIRAGMIDKDGNITNYSMRNEIVQITSAMEFRYA